MTENIAIIKQLQPLIDMSSRYEQTQIAFETNQLSVLIFSFINGSYKLKQSAGQGPINYWLTDY
ncbi:MAG: hypothetical protein ACTS77_01190 [Arsenophonus sp. NC-TX2-MAG3]